MYSFFLNFDIVHSNLSEYLCLHIFSKSQTNIQMCRISFPILKLLHILSSLQN